jgi:DNA-binding response OmpR family regulator
MPRRRVILYAERNITLMYLVKDVLELAGWMVRHCSDGMVLLDHLHGPDPFDVVVLNKELPSLDGFAVVKEARKYKHRKHTPYVMLSMDDVGERARRAGIDAFIQKPDNLHNLVATIRRLLVEVRAREKSLKTAGAEPDDYYYGEEEDKSDEKPQSEDSDA